MKRKGLVLASALLMMMAVSVVGCSQKSSTVAADNNQSKLFMKIPSVNHEKAFPKGHKMVDGKECILDRETDSYFCQYYNEYDGYINK